ncbi:MAG: C-terminal binding protein [Verrucomicrobia bacterium]|nr:C-terminal binding protein [Verrucomicrobiota bacterium]
MHTIKPRVAIIRNCVGLESVDIDAAEKRRIAVCNLPASGTQEVADHAIILALAFCRRLCPSEAESKKVGGLIKDESQMLRLRGLTFGIIGLGRIGTATALLTKTFGFKVCFYDPYLPTGEDKAAEIVRSRTLEELLRHADVVSLHCPLTRETQHMIGEREMAWMKPTAFIVNTARVAIIKKAAILAALREGQLGGAGFGVTEDEAFEAFSSPEEATTPNLIVICHAAFSCVEAKKEMRTTSARIAHATVWGESLENVVHAKQMQSRK